LQTYDEGQRATDAIPFLDSVYDVLCLMGGNLLVGTLRPDVVDRWRDHYAGALAQLEADGLQLIADDEERHMVRRSHSNGEAAHDHTPFEGVRSDSDLDTYDGGDAFPTVDEFAAEAAFVDDDED